jgi:protein-disulfide isomerase
MSPSERTDFQRLQRDVLILQKQVDELSKQNRSQGQRVPATAAARPGVSLDDDPVMGASDAAVALIEFSDYQCPYCQRFHEKTFPRLKSKYIDSGKVRYVYRDMPSPSRGQAVYAAIAANCAGEQGKYFEMHKVLFENGSRLENKSYVRFARKLGLHIAKFEACLVNEKQLDEIGKDIQDGQRLGVRGTPTFFIGKIRDNTIEDPKSIVGAQPYRVFNKVLEDVLRGT